MRIEDFRVLTCTKCGREESFYAPPLSKDEELRKMEVEEYTEDFEVSITDDGKFVKKCEKCGEQMAEISIDEWHIPLITETIGDMMEDDNHHSLTGLGRCFNECMMKAGIDDELRRKALIEYMKLYSETGRICGY